jgi:hypothetical protein
MSIDRDQLRQFEVVAFGCHERAHRRLTRFLQKECEDIQTYLFVEYFCGEPVPFVRADDCWKETTLFFPFIRRLVETNQFLWIHMPNGKFELKPKIPEVIKHFDDPATFSLPTGYAEVGIATFQWWRDHGSLSRGSATDKVSWPPPRHYGTSEWKAYGRFIRTAPRKDREVLLREFGLLGEAWVRTGEPTTVFGFPIATDAIFYGYFMLILPVKAAELKGKGTLVKIQEKLAELAGRLYLPVLAVLSESLLEKKFADRIEEAVRDEALWIDAAEGVMTDESIPFLPCTQGASPHDGHRTCPAPDRPYNADIEVGLHRLWYRRRNLLKRLRDSESDRLRFVDTLSFKKYFVASPGLVDQLRNIIGTDFKMSDERKPLPAALVYGGPGSGKEVLARLIPLFSSDYFFYEVHTLNMAALRPSAITGPLLQGISLGHGGGKVSLEGLLVEAKRRAQLCNPGKQEQPSAICEGGPTRKLGAAFILDELNSLDVDLQGILLRILEQGEVMPLFGLETEYVQHLIVGVVNEDPEEISRESELRDLLQEKGALGSLISGFLYETLRRTRRLREDLCHRLKRQLYVHVQDLKDRREDIPMLFYVSASEEVKEQGHKDQAFIVALEAYRLLMDPHIRWPGNIRQVQSVARRSVEVARTGKTARSNVGSFFVTREHVLKALKDEFRGIQLDGNGPSKERGEAADAGN